MSYHRSEMLLVDLLLGLLQAGLCGLHCNICHHCSCQCTKTEEEAAGAYGKKERALTYNGIENLNRRPFFRPRF